MKRTLTKPKKPEKKIRVDRTADFSFTNYYPKTSSVKELLDWIEETLPDGVKDTGASIELAQEWAYDDCTSYIRLNWSEVVPNPNYDRQMKKYQTQLDRWNKQKP
jgi:hypothetical protein